MSGDGIAYSDSKSPPLPPKSANAKRSVTASERLGMEEWFVASLKKTERSIVKSFDCLISGCCSGCLVATRTFFKCAKSPRFRVVACFLGLILGIWLFSTQQLSDNENRSLLFDKLYTAVSGGDPSMHYDREQTLGRKAVRHFYEVPKGWLNLNTQRVVVSGFSNTGDFAHQVHIAFSSMVNAACIYAGQPYQCATTYFGGEDPLVRKSGGNHHAVPVCEHCPRGKTLAYDHCKNHPQVIDIGVLVDKVRRTPDLDDHRNLLHPDQRVYLYRGTMDNSYQNGSVASVEGLYAQLMKDSNSQILFRNDIPEGHHVPGRAAGRVDVREECLKHTLMRGEIQPPGVVNYSHVYSINQRRFIHEEDRNAGFGYKTWIYAPLACQNFAADDLSKANKKAAPEGCQVFIWFNSCGGGSGTYDTIEFEAYAETNNLVVIIPTVVPNNCWKRKSARGCGGSVMRACWDVYGHLGADYALRSGPHMRLFKRILTHILENASRQLLGFGKAATMQLGQLEYHGPTALFIRQTQLRECRRLVQTHDHVLDVRLTYF
ncbi:hypothetical protein AAMO2058_000583300 [Amorphochlora amoebiformis]